MSGPRLIVHGHFYQPPRENPWTEQVGREQSAHPAHDWNERIAAECYRPNALARIVDDSNRVVNIVDNYAHISYNVGPTLLSWLENHEPDTYRRMINGDRIGGGAIAQAFGHTILPLATEADIRTQIRWGLADFRHRFGREAEGMWLPECAVNDLVLRVMTEEGVGFTILAPGQASRIRPVGSSDNESWTDISQGQLDTTRPYRWLHPDADGKGMDIVFYDGDLSHAVAFGMSSFTSGMLLDRMAAAGANTDGFVSLATDGETFGHHHKYGERLLAYALEVEAPQRGLPHSNYNVALDQIRPRHEVRVHESAWSCAHGVGRWKEDCGCSTGGELGWNQQWRAPLRSALDRLRSVVDAVYDQRARGVLGEPREALDAYINVLIGAVTKSEFVARHVTGDPVEAFTLLESQRHAMAMFTSCGWFFNDLAGLETVQVLRYAARVLDLLDELGETSPMPIFRTTLAQAHSNVAEEGTGVDIWMRHVEPARVDAARVVEHVALGQVLENELRSLLGPYEVTVYGRTREQSGSITLASGIAHLIHRRTNRECNYAYVAVGLGGLEVAGVLSEVEDPHDESPMEGVRSAFARSASISQLLNLLKTVGDREFSLGAALPEEAERLMKNTADSLEDRYASTYERLYDDNRATLEDLARRGYPLSTMLKVPAEFALARRFREAVFSAAASTDPSAYEAAISIAHQARTAGFQVDTPETTFAMEKLLTDSVVHAARTLSARAVEVALNVVTLKNELGVPVNVEPSQEAVFFATGEPDELELLEPLAEAVGVNLGA